MQPTSLRAMRSTMARAKSAAIDDAVIATRSPPQAQSRTAATEAVSKTWIHSRKRLCIVW